MHGLTRIRPKPAITPAAAQPGTPHPFKVASAGRLQVVPISPAPAQVRPDIKHHDVVVGLYHWATCLFIIALVCSQLLAALWDSITTVEHRLYGRIPQLGPSQIVGTNDVPFPDRVIACVRTKNFYEPRLVSSLLAAPGVSAVLEDSTGTAAHGYRLRQRRVGRVTDTLDSAAQAVYESSCALIADTIDNILGACQALGYSNLTQDDLRVVGDWDSTSLHRLPNTLPVLILPFWDNAPSARHAVPTWGGDACMFRLGDAYTGVNRGSGVASFRGVNRSVRHERTIEWLQRPGGSWKNGWYQDPDGIRWYSDVKSSWRGGQYNMMHRQFDMRSGQEVDCSDPNNCEVPVLVQRWGDKFSSTDQPRKVSSISIANGTEFGVFMYESFVHHTVKSVFDWETLVSNLSVGLVLMRWVVGLVSLHSGAVRGKTHWFSGGIGCVSGASSFHLLPLVSLPRLKMTLAAFWTVGCRFEGQQAGLAEAWFVIYPAIANFVLIYFSLLNLLAKALRRRISEGSFTPTVVALCLLHYFRVELAASGWLRGVDGRIRTVVFSDEVKRLQLIDFFTTDISWRMNGRVSLIFGLKLAILGINLLPLIFAKSLPIGNRSTDLNVYGVEEALALRAQSDGGLGRSLTYIVVLIDRKLRRVSSMSYTSKLVTGNEDHENISSNMMTPVTPLLESTATSRPCPSPYQHKIVLVNSYELIRLGYLVYGDKYLITFDEWDLLSAMAPFRAFCHLWNHRVVVWTLRPVVDNGDAELTGDRALQDTEPEIWRLDDPRLQQISWWRVSACNIQC